MPKDTDSNYAAYEKYLNSLPADAPIHFSAANAAQEELRLGEKGGYPVYKDELSKDEKFANMPEGSLQKTELSTEQIHSAVAYFEEKIPEIVDWIKKGLVSTLKGVTLEEEIQDIKGRQAAKVLSEEEIALYPEILITFNKLKTFEIPSETETYNLLSEIKEKTKLFKELLTRKSKLNA